MSAAALLAGTAMLLLGLLLPLRRAAAASRLVAAQGGLLALAAASVAWGGAGEAHLWLLALGALAGRALPVPALLRLAAGRAGAGAAPRRAGEFSSRPEGTSLPGDEGARSPRADGASPLRVQSVGPSSVARATRPAPSAAAAVLVGGALAVLAVAAVASAGGGTTEAGTREGLALALAILLAGLLAALLRRGVGFGLLGLLSAENGALLGVVHAGGAHGAAALAVLSPGLVACVALALLRNRGDVLRALPRAMRR